MSVDYKPITGVEDMTVLVVDDDAMVRCIVVEYLKSFGFAIVLEAKNGAEALKFVRNYKLSIDLIVSDWQMPQMDGHILLKAVRSDSIRANTKFIMVTSQSSQERFKISRAKLLSVDGYIIKPFHGNVLRDKVMQVLNIGEAGAVAIDPFEDFKKKIS
jgi:two-component system chemotaxis response regulator CheY